MILLRWFQIVSMVCLRWYDRNHGQFNEFLRLFLVCHHSPWSFSIVLYVMFLSTPPACDIKIFPKGGRDIQQIKYGCVPTEKVLSWKNVKISFLQIIAMKLFLLNLWKQAQTCCNIAFWGCTHIRDCKILRNGFFQRESECSLRI